MMAQWFFPGDGWTADAQVDLRVGGRWEVVMRDPANVLHRQFGEYREIVRASRLVFTWCCPDLGVVDSVVTIELKQAGDHTELALTHELPPDPKIREGHLEGWKGCLGNLDKHLASPRSTSELG
jgi:uncharacterized protein YndB with AHSA1/START domain